MKLFFLKYKWSILYWVVFLFIVLIFAPRQSDYYLDSDIKNFKKASLTPFLIWTWGIISIAFFFILFTKTKSFKTSSLSFLYISLIVAFFLFIFQGLFLAGALFINRQFKRESFKKNYVVNYLTGIEKTKDNFIPYDASIKQISIDEKLIEKLYQPGLNQNDTVSLRFDKGLLGIEFPGKSFEAK